MTRQRGRLLAAVLALLVASALHPLTAGARPVVDSAAALTITMTQVLPTIAVGDEDVVLTGYVTNISGAPLPAPDVQLTGSFAPLVGRAAVAAWAAGQTRGVPVDGIDHDALGGTLAPGGSATFRLTVSAPATASDVPFAALPMAINAGDATLTTFITVNRRVEYEPLQLAVLAPVTLEPDAALVAPYGPQRLAAWRTQLSTTSRAQRLLDATRDLPVTLAIDPTLLTPPADIPQVRPTDAAAGAAWDRITAEQRTETTLRRAAETQLRARLAGQPTVILPQADADLGALLANPELSPRIAPALQVAQGVAATLPDATAQILWPADGRLGSERITALTEASGSLRPRAVIGAGSALGAGTVEAAHPGPAGIAALAYDERLSNSLLDLEADPVGARMTQRLLADSLALLGEFPGRQRSVLIAAPRTLNPRASALESSLRALLEAPWVRPVQVSEVIAGAAGGSVIPAVAPATLPRIPGIPRDPSVAREALTPSRNTALKAALDALAPVAEVRADGAANWAFWTEVSAHAASSRWRADRSLLLPVIASARTAGAQARTAIAVVPDRINFFADSGQLQVTITNDLDVAVEEVQVVLTSLVPSFRLTGTPEPVTIGARSRATVRVPATALAAGSVPIRVRLFSPGEQHIGVDNTVQVRAYPTGSWFYWLLAGVALLLFAAGLWRGRRRRRAAAADSVIGTSGDAP